MDKKFLLVNKAKTNAPKIYLDGVAYDIKEGQTWGEFKEEHSEFDFTNNRRFINTSIPFYKWLNFGMSDEKDLEVLDAYGTKLDFSFVEPKTNINYLTDFEINDDETILPQNIEGLISYIFVETTRGYDSQKERNMMESAIDFENTMIIYLGDTMTILTYPKNKKIHEPFIHNFKYNVRINTPQTDENKYWVLGYPALPKNGANLIFPQLILLGFSNNDSEIPHKFYIDNKIDDIIYSYKDESNGKVTNCTAPQILLEYGYNYNNGNSTTYFYNDTDIMVFNDGEYTIAQLKEKYNIS